MLGFGTYRLQGSACQKAVENAFECGYRLIDTASSYLNEKAVGAACAASGLPRKEIFISSKIWLNNTNKDGARRSVVGSIQRLGMDRLDLCLVHMPIGDWHGAWHGLEECLRDGLCAAIGVSNFSPARLAELMAFHDVLPAVDQIELNLFCQRWNWLKYLAIKNVMPQAWSPLAQGDIPHKTGVSAPLAIAWMLDRGIPVIVQTTDMAHLQENMKAFELTVDETLMTRWMALDGAQSSRLNLEDPDVIAKLCAALKPSSAELLRACRAARRKFAGIER